LRVHVATWVAAVCYGGGGRSVIDVAGLCLLGAACLIAAATVMFGDVGLTAGLAVFGVACIVLASIRAKKVRRGAT